MEAPRRLTGILVSTVLHQVYFLYFSLHKCTVIQVLTRQSLCLMAKCAEFQDDRFKTATFYSPMPRGGSFKCSFSGPSTCFVQPYTADGIVKRLVGCFLTHWRCLLIMSGSLLNFLSQKGSQAPNSLRTPDQGETSPPELSFISSECNFFCLIGSLGFSNNTCHILFTRVAINSISFQEIHKFQFYSMLFN